MNNARPKPGFIVVLALSIVMVTGCAGTKVLREPQLIQTTQPLAVMSDQQVTASLDWVIVRNGPGTWAKNADWDEYLLRVSNRSDQPVEVLHLTVVDALGARVEPQFGRKQLVGSSKKTARRYKASGMKVKAGRGAGTMLVAGAAVTTAAVGVANAVAYGSIMSGASTAGTAGAIAGGLLVLGPALAVGGIVRGVNNSKVNQQIELRQTRLPLTIPAQEELRLNVFFPLTPSPQKVDLMYTSALGEHSLALDTHAALDGLHLVEPQK